MNEETDRFNMPAEWCVLWPKPTTLHSVNIHWCEDLLPLEFALEVSNDGETWTELYQQADDIPAVTDFTLPEPATARYFRIHITRAQNEKGNVGIREVFLH
jgi:hypothetical protein